MKKLLENTKISVKIIALLLMLGAITLFVTWTGARNLATADAGYSELTDRDMMSAWRLTRAHQRMTGMLYQGFKVRVYDGASALAQDAAKQLDADYKSGLEQLAEVKRARPDHPIVDRVSADYEKIHDIVERSIPLGLANRNDEAERVLAQAVPIEQEVSAKIRDVNNKAVLDVTARTKELSATSESTSMTMYILAIGSLLGAIALALAVVRFGITGPMDALKKQMTDIAGGDYTVDIPGASRGDELGPMGKAVLVFRDNGAAKQAADAAKARADAEQKMVVETVSSHLSELSGGDLTATITTDFPGEYTALKANFNEALGKLRELIGAVSESAATIRTGSGEIAQASEDLARRTESNAASLEETAASVTQMDGRLKASAQAASRTVERADQAIATVGGGRAVADDAMQAMNRVSDSAKGIDSVIEGLDKIAFQTRVLAMNAAVEAGRAGDAGRGFAVVADLVSALAMRAEEEAKRARDQLTVTQTDIVTAVEAVQKVDTALGNISGDVGQVHELLATMAADNQAQSAAITQISSAIGTMDQATQQNAAMVEQTSAAARNLAAEVGGLSEQAGRFNVGNAEAVARSIVKNPPPARGRKADAKAYASPVKPLPAAGIAALVRADDDWNAF